MKINPKVVGVAALAAVLIIGSYFGASNSNQERSSTAAPEPSLAPDAASEQARMESVPAPQVSTEFSQLPESESVGTSPPRRQRQSSDASSNHD